MNKAKLFLDTVFIQAILNPHDQYHQAAMQFLPYVKKATMEENQVTDALTSDIHFVQAGFQALLR